MTKMSSMADSLVFLAQQTASPAASPNASSQMFSQFGIMALLFGGMYFLLIAPQRKKQKELEKMIAGLQSGDEVITNSGIFGTITNVKEDRFVIRVADNTKIEVAKGFIQSVTSKKDAPEKK